MREREIEAGGKVSMQVQVEWYPVSTCYAHLIVRQNKPSMSHELSLAEKLKGDGTTYL